MMDKKIVLSIDCLVLSTNAVPLMPTAGHPMRTESHSCSCTLNKTLQRSNACSRDNSGRRNVTDKLLESFAIHNTSHAPQLAYSFSGNAVPNRCQRSAKQGRRHVGCYSSSDIKYLNVCCTAAQCQKYSDQLTATVFQAHRLEGYRRALADVSAQQKELVVKGSHRYERLTEHRKESKHGQCGIIRVSVPR